jgi:hypothetical protein
MHELARACVAAALIVIGVVPVAGRLQRGPAAATPIDAHAAILSAFETHNIVAITDPHGNTAAQAFLLSLLREPRFTAVVDDVVLETASARYQDVLDRFVRGEDVDRDSLRPVWEEHTVPNSLGAEAEETIRAVRLINSSIGSGASRKLRVIAGDPPIDWDNVTSRDDHRHWIELRDSYPADLIRHQVLDRGRRALVIYGQGHLQRMQIASNYDMSTWQAQSLVSWLAQDHAARIFNIWSLIDATVETPAELSSWRVPSLALLKNTSLGQMDFGHYAGLMGAGPRFAVRDGQLVALPREAWKTMRMEDQFDALLYLGPPASMTTASVPRALCQDTAFVVRRLDRLTRFSPPPEIDRFKRACGL